MAHVSVSPGLRVTPRTCPVCHLECDGATSISLDGPPETPPVPEPGAITVCAVCATILIVEEVDFRVASPADMAEFPPDTLYVVRSVQRFFAQHRAIRN